MLLSGLLTAIRMTSEDFIHLGELSEIHMQEGILIMDTTENVAVVFMVSQSSRYLRESIKKFTQDFEKEYGIIVKENCESVDLFNDAELLVKKHFSYVPHED